MKLPAPDDVEPDDLFHTLSPASQERVCVALAMPGDYDFLETLTKEEWAAQEEIHDRRGYRAAKEREAQRQREFEEKRQSRLVDPSAGPEPKRNTREWHDWLDGKEPVPKKEEPEPEEPEPEKAFKRPPVETEGASLLALIPAPDPTKKCWCLMQRGLTQEHKTQDGKQPERGLLLILKEFW